MRIVCSYDVNNPTVWRLEQEYIRNNLHVPKGFIWDGASVPKLVQNVFPKWGDYSGAALMHDYMYRKECKEITKRNIADSIFLDNMKEDGVSWWRRYTIYWGVRAGGWASFKKR